MLSQILKEFRESGGVISLDELSRRLGVARSALDGMLETLVRQGRLREVVAAAAGGCHCGGGCHGCSHATAANTGKSYQLIAGGQEEGKA